MNSYLPIIEAEYIWAFKAFYKHFERFNTAGHLDSASRTAVQLAFCYHAGFGVRRDISTLLKFLMLSK